MIQHLSLHSQLKRGSSTKREHSSVGSEHLPYKQRVRGSSPCAPTQYSKGFHENETLFLFGILHTISDANTTLLGPSSDLMFNNAEVQPGLIQQSF